MDALELFSVDDFGGVSGGSSIYVLVCGRRCGGCAGHWGDRLVCGPWDSGGMGGAVSVSVAFCLGVLVGAGDVASGGCVTAAVWGDFACGAGCGPLKLEGWSKMEHSFMGVWP